MTAVSAITLNRRMWRQPGATPKLKHRKPSTASSDAAAMEIVAAKVISIGTSPKLLACELMPRVHADTPCRVCGCPKPVNPIQAHGSKRQDPTLLELDCLSPDAVFWLFVSLRARAGFMFTGMGVFAALAR